MLPMSRPPLLPPMRRRCFTEVILRLTRSSATAAKVFVGPVALFLEGGLVPLRAEFAAAADVGHDVHAALLQPRRPG